jgi:hypothetical protein
LESGLVAVASLQIHTFNTINLLKYSNSMYYSSQCQ